MGAKVDATFRPTPSSEIAWHILDGAAAAARLGSGPDGLSDAEAAARLARVGPNRVDRVEPTPALRVLRDQLTSIVVWLLAAAVVVSIALGDVAEALAIGVVLLLNTLLGFTMDLRARRAMDALLRLDDARCAVVRAGTPAFIDAWLLVPGDVVDVRRGQNVPADARLLTTHDLRVVEAALTGESLPVSKDAAATLDAATPLAERITMIYKGTTIAAGAARAVVVATGRETELGRIGALVAGIHEGQTPLERRLDELGTRLVWLVLVMAFVSAALHLAHGAPWTLVLEMGLALAVAAVPEALPAVATIALAIGLRRMAARQALVRRLASVEALGSVTVVCSDKTRTLTSGDMTLVTVWTPDGAFDLGGPDAAAAAGNVAASALEIAVLASRPPAGPDGSAGAIDDPVDVALLRGAVHAGVDVDAAVHARPPAAVLPFSSERKLTAVFAPDGDGLAASVKGAPGRILDLCASVQRDGRPAPLAAAERAELADVTGRLADSGLRVLGLASGRVADASEAGLRDLTFVGFVGLMDPVAEGVPATIRRLRGAGLRTIMLTGDQRNTAHAIGRELGLVTGLEQVVDGRELQGLSGDALGARVREAGAFSRIAPEDKLRVVRSLQAQGEIVAMLGDGVNDAAALKQADVGVAMGRRGTDVAKEAAAIVLQDDRFETIAAAVEEGRVVYDNIRKFVFYLFSCNLAEVLVLAVAALAALPPPLLPLQILWLNLVTDTFPALALALEPADRDVMQRPPRDPREALLSARFIGSVSLYAALITASAIVAFVWALQHAPDHATTLCFMTLALAQVFHLGNARSRHHVLHPARALVNGAAVLAVVLAIALQAIAVSVPAIATTLRVAPLSVREWGVVLALAAVPAIVGQVVKAVYARRR